MTEAGVDARPMSLATALHVHTWNTLSAFPTPGTSAPSRHCGQGMRWPSSARSVTYAARNPTAILVAGGIGVTPLKGMAEYATDRELPIPIRLVYSSRSEDEIAYGAELAALERQDPHFRVLHTLTGAVGPGWGSATGRIDRNLLREAARDLTDPIYYVSGTPSMVVEAWHLLREEGIPAHSIQVEAFRGYR